MSGRRGQVSQVLLSRTVDLCLLLHRSSPVSRVSIQKSAASRANVAHPIQSTWFYHVEARTTSSNILIFKRSLTTSTACWAFSNLPIDWHLCFPIPTSYYCR